MKKSQLMLNIQNGIEVFENPIFGQIRMVMVDDEPWFVAKDISDKIIFMADGIIEEMGTPSEVFDNPKSPKTKAFLLKTEENYICEDATL